MTDYLIGAFSLIGSFFLLISSLGILRFPDLFTRMHAAGKALTFGLGMLLLALIMQFQDLEISLKAVVIIVLLFITAPMSAQVLSRAERTMMEKKSKD